MHFRWKMFSEILRSNYLKLFFLLLTNLVFLNQVVFAVPGNLDSSFGTNGFVSTGGNDTARDIVIQPDGKIIIAGTYQINGNQDFSLARLNPDGSLDSSFGINGKVVTPFNNFDSLDNAWAVALQTDGKIVLAGTFSDGSGFLVAVARYNTDGSLDASFDGDGKVTASVGFLGMISSVAVQPDGKIIAVGTFNSGSPTSGDFIAVRFTSDGKVDPSFDNDGIVITDLGGSSSDQAYTIALQTDGKIILGGYSINGFNCCYFALARYTSNGSLDASFGSEGKVVISISNASTQDSINSLIIQPDGKIIAVGSSIGNFTNAALARFNPNGSIDNSFGVGGKVITSISPQHDLLSDVVLQSDGKLVVSGLRHTEATYFDPVVGRYNSNGTPDTSFGDGGFSSVALSRGDDRAVGVVLQSSGKIIVACTGGFSGFGAVRFLINGSRVVDFDGDMKTDISIYRPDLGQWWYLRSSNGANRAFAFGSSSDKIVPADYTGDGKTDIAYFHPSTGEWFIMRSEDSSYYGFPFGEATDIPLAADFDGDGKADPTVFRPSTQVWYTVKSTGGTEIRQFGSIGDVPVAADYDGDGKADIAIFRPLVAEWWIQKSTGGSLVYQFGANGDKAVPFDYTGDGKTDVAFYRPSSGEWYVLRSENQSFYAAPFGGLEDLPIPGDYDGDGKADFAVFRPSINAWFVNKSTGGTQILSFGQTGDKPVANAFMQ